MDLSFFFECGVLSQLFQCPLSLSSRGSLVSLGRYIPEYFILFIARGTGMIQRDDMRWEGGPGSGAHIHPWQIHVNVWQNQYSIVKQNKVKIKIKKKRQIPFTSEI